MEMQTACAICIPYLLLHVENQRLHFLNKFCNPINSGHADRISFMRFVCPAAYAQEKKLRFCKSQSSTHGESTDRISIVCSLYPTAYAPKQFLIFNNAYKGEVPSPFFEPSHGLAQKFIIHPSQTYTHTPKSSFLRPYPISKQANKAKFRFAIFYTFLQTLIPFLTNKLQQNYSNKMSRERHT